jgi:hypothetical protein
MKSLIFFASLSLSFISLKAQRTDFTLTGKVVDQSTQLPLSGASVFCQNTTVGVISNSEGNFTLRLASGGYDLIVSYTGYETFSQRINDQLSGSPLLIELKKQDKVMQEVAVVGSNEVADGWAKYGKFFLENFIGTTPNAGACKVENTDSLHFYFSKKRNRLKILTTADLIIVNNALGYKIRYQLDSFVHEYTDGISTFSGYPLFEEIEGTDSQRVAWNTNRAKAYNGSRMHFMRSWYDSSLTRQGFAIERLPDSTSINGVLIENPFDSSFYHADSSDVEIDLKGRFRVVYQSELPDAQYLALYKFSPHTRVQISAVDIADVFIIERNGYFYEQSDLVNSGYWSWEKLADALPYNYTPAR